MALQLKAKCRSVSSACHTSSSYYTNRIECQYLGCLILDGDNVQDLPPPLCPVPRDAAWVIKSYSVHFFKTCADRWEIGTSVA
jgi:hypothetical protein